LGENSGSAETISACLCCRSGFVADKAVLKLSAKSEYSLLLELVYLRKALNSITAMLASLFLLSLHCRDFTHNYRNTV
jgi:hypothetical protein